MVAKLPVLGETTTRVRHGMGLQPVSVRQPTSSRAPTSPSSRALPSSSPRASARKDAYLTFQEYFGSLRDEARALGQARARRCSARLWRRCDLGVGSIGGKDSMSGSFENLDVPPTLVSFATACRHGRPRDIPEFKGAGTWRRAASHPVTRSDGLHARDRRSARMLRHGREAHRHRSARSPSPPPGFGGRRRGCSSRCASATASASISTRSAPPTRLFELALRQRSSSSLPTAQSFPKTENICTSIELGQTIDGIRVRRCAARPCVLPSCRKHGNASSRTYSRIADDERLRRRARSPTRRDIPLTYCGDYCQTARHYSGLPGQQLRVRLRRSPSSAPAPCPRPSSSTTSRPHAVAESTEGASSRKSTTSQIIMIPGGFSGGDEPDGSAKFITAFFRAPEVTEAVRRLLNDRDGLMLGICNGFQALVKLGLVPVRRHPPDGCQAARRSTFNSDRPSPEPHRAHARSVQPVAVALALRSGRHPYRRHQPRRGPLRRERRARSSSLRANGQIATQYVDADGHAVYGPGDVNPNGSVTRHRGHHEPRRTRARQDGAHRASRARAYTQNIPDYTLPAAHRRRRGLLHRLARTFSARISTKACSPHRGQAFSLLRKDFAYTNTREPWHCHTPHARRSKSMALPHIPRAPVNRRATRSSVRRWSACPRAASSAPRTGSCTEP